MKLNIYSRKAMEEKLSGGMPEDTAIISFYAPPQTCRGESNGRIDFGENAENVFYVELRDLDIDVLEDFGLSEETYLQCADELAAFIYKAKEAEMNIICQCEYGQSRSAGCAAAILQHFSKRGIEIFANYKYYPNQLVYNKVFEALERYKNSITVS